MHKRTAVTMTAGMVASMLAIATQPAFAAQPKSDPGTNPAAIAAYRLANDQDPHVALTDATKQLIARKDEQLQASGRTQPTGSGTVAAPAVAQDTRLLSRFLRQQQQDPAWCGPAAASMALFTRSIDVDQATLAYYLRTDAGGTAWSGVQSNAPVANTWRPMPDVLNYFMGFTWFTPIEVSGNPTATEKSNYRTRMWVIDSGYPMVGDAWEAPGGPHLAGHPINQEIFHWYTIYGYGNWASTTYYLDSAGFAANGGFGSISSDTLTVINGGRGYLY